MYAKTIKLFPCILIFFYVTQVHGAATLPTQAIHLSFSHDLTTLHATALITQPAGVPLHLFVNNLEQVTLTGKADEPATEIKPDADHTYFLKPSLHQQQLRLSWQISNVRAEKNGNLISKDGIALTGPWHPTSDGDMLYSLTAELPRGFTGITEAETLHLQKNRQGTRLTATYPHPVQSINFAAGPYVVSSKKVGKIKIFTYFFKEDQNLAAGYLQKATGYIKRYEKLIGPFPYPRYAIVENRQPTGYGMPTFTLLGQSIIRLPFIKETSLGHEILHSWFGNALRLDGTGNWCEGLTTYLADQSFAVERKKGVAFRKNQLLRYQATVSGNTTTCLIDFRHGGDAQAMAKQMQSIGYDRGSMFFHMLRKKMGNASFFKALQALYRQHAFQRIGWAEIEKQCSAIAQEDLTAFFSQWLLRHDVPVIMARDITLQQQQGKSVVLFSLHQDNPAPFQLQIPIAIHTLTGVDKAIVAVKDNDQRLQLVVDTVPTTLVIDPDYDIMRHLDPTEIPPTWRLFQEAQQKTVVLPEQPEEKQRYLPLITSLEKKGCTLIQAQELKNSELNQGSFIFLGSSHHRQGLFGSSGPPKQGFTLDARKNPLNPDQVIILVNSHSTEQTAAVVNKLAHYSKYSYLHFINGSIKKKQIADAENGISSPLVALPAGVPVQAMENFSTITDKLAQNRVIYVGETHTDYGAHLLQLQIIQALAAQKKDLMIGMEMFPRSSQEALNDYISGKINDERLFLRQSKYFKVWGFDYRFYRGIIGYAKKHGIPIIGLNLDKQIVSTVFQQGSTDSLSKEQIRQVAAERDLTLPGYRERLKAIHSMHGNQGQDPSAGFAGFLQAQSMWDETMAESIVDALKTYPQKTMVVLAGTGHVYKDSAIPARVARRMPVKQAVLIAADGMDTGREKGRQADYLMFTESVELPPAGKIGIVLNEQPPTDTLPGRLEIIDISPHGKAPAAGLRKKDIIVAIDDIPVNSLADLKTGLLDKAPGDKVKITVARDNRQQSLTVELTNMATPAIMLPPGHPKK